MFKTGLQYVFIPCQLLVICYIPLRLASYFTIFVWSSLWFSLFSGDSSILAPQRGASNKASDSLQPKLGSQITILYGHGLSSPFDLMAIAGACSISSGDAPLVGDTSTKFFIF